MSKFEQVDNENYAAVVVKLTAIKELEGCDNVVGTPIFGYQAIVGKSTEVGQIGILFPAESQLSEEYARENNLHRHGDKNKDQGAKGYLEDNRRVKAMKFRGHRSDALFMPLESFNYTGFDVSTLEEGDVFDKLNGHEICKKFVRRPEKVPATQKNKGKVFSRVDKKFLPEHYSTENYWRNQHNVKGDRKVIVTQKLHGTSIRLGNTIVSRELTLLEKIAKKLGVKVQDKEHDYVFGSRKVIKDINNPNQNHFYSTDIWTEYGKSVESQIPEGFLIYGELVGYTQEGNALQKGYTYQIPQGQAEMYVYRVATVNGEGRVTDLSWEQVKEFCRDQGFKYVPELWVGLHRNFDVDEFMDKKFASQKGKWIPGNAIPLSDDSPCDEGVCIRVDGLSPYILKAKSPKFLAHETEMLDKEVVDIEEEQK